MKRTPPSSLTHLVRVALLVAAGDYVTKWVAATWLAAESVSPRSIVSFAVVHNDLAAYSLSVGAHTWEINLALTLATIALVLPVSRELARLDRFAPVALGLIAGGALGNLASLVLSPAGVVDFIALRPGTQNAIVVNVADISAYTGLALLLRTGVRVARALRAGRPGAPTPPAARPRIVRHVARGDAEIPRLIYVDGATAAFPALPFGEAVTAGNRTTAPRLADVASAARRSRREGAAQRHPSRSPVRPMSHPLPDPSESS